MFGGINMTFLMKIALGGENQEIKEKFLKILTPNIIEALIK
ncbi:MAG: hypothetical protein HeimC3_00080 [Candidatus Heimdallarchaeota archaeon LC_3]|nr:MAG: hypothetical protein HeimC3_50330 [Candidatus Heimdallarchaeota archaeon LC_3]OLS28049.1 MAG: hypothetical protein HeimC3_00080 [Candidatus Heimdallarchaeota archaeon LC_3]